MWRYLLLGILSILVGLVMYRNRDFRAESLAINHKYVQQKPYFHERKLLDQTIPRLPENLKDRVVKSYFERFLGGDKVSPHNSIVKIKAVLDGLGISLSDNDSRIADIALIRAENSQLIYFEKGADAVLNYVEIVGINVPAGKTIYTKALRVITHEWWERRLKKYQLMAQETIAREFGVVNKKNNIYVSDSAVSRVEARRYQSWQVLKKLECVNQDDNTERLNMFDVASASIANPANRHNELMVRASGFDAYAQSNSHVADFYTVTTPSKYHAYHYTGHKNKKFAGATPRDAQDYLVKVWAQVRAKLKRESIQIYGLRIAEPHHDGTPHWHMLLYVQKSHRQQLRRIIRTYVMYEDNEELNTDRRRDARYKVEGINFARGSGASYILKYIAKNIEGIKGADSEDYESGTDSNATAGRVSVWASVWGIRQFQQIGGGSISVWRELRKLRDKTEGEINSDMYALWLSADSNEWSKFIELLGGADMPRSQQLAGLYKEISPPELRLNSDTGELIDIALNKYGEEIEEVRGVLFPSGVLNTRLKTWKIEKVSLSDCAPLEFCK